MEKILEKASKALGKKIGVEGGDMADFFSQEIAHPDAQKLMDIDSDGDGIDDYIESIINQNM